MQCPSCSKSSPDEDLFCPNCGVVFDLYEAEKSESPLPASLGIWLSKKCPLCGRKIPERHLFCVNCGTVMDALRTTEQNLAPGSVVRWTPEKKRTPAATEIVNVPSGATVTVRRSRTVEHTIEVDWRASLEIGLEAGIKEIVSASIRSEVEKTQGHAYKQSETVEYEVQLNGEKHNRYKLIWTDIWRTGAVDIKTRIMNCSLPFELRMQAELEVVPFE